MKSIVVDSNNSLHETSKHNWYSCLDSNFTLNNGKIRRCFDTRLLHVFIIRFWDNTIFFRGHTKKTNFRVINILCSLSNQSGSTKLLILNQWIVIRLIKRSNKVVRTHTDILVFICHILVIRFDIFLHD